MLSPASLERRLEDNLGCQGDIGIVHLVKLVAFSESSLPQKLSFQILFVRNLTIRVLQLLFDNLGLLVLLRVDIGVTRS